MANIGKAELQIVQNESGLALRQELSALHEQFNPFEMAQAAFEGLRDPLSLRSPGEQHTRWSRELARSATLDNSLHIFWLELAT